MEKKSNNQYQKSIDLLNVAVGHEIATSMQYMSFHVVFSDAGYEFLAKRMKKISIDEMKHIEELSERILFLEGAVNMNQGFKVLHIIDPVEAYQLALKLETQTVKEYQDNTAATAAIGDTVTSHMFQELAAQEEEHLDYFRTELQNFKDYGTKEYLALQSIAWSKNGQTD